jgi:hypothetical protein
MKASAESGKFGKIFQPVGIALPPTIRAVE